MYLISLRLSLFRNVGTIWFCKTICLILAAFSLFVKIKVDTIKPILYLHGIYGHIGMYHICGHNLYGENCNWESVTTTTTESAIYWWTLKGLISSCHRLRSLDMALAKQNLEVETVWGSVSSTMPDCLYGCILYVCKTFQSSAKRSM